jgi:hypothetical protein
MEQTADGLAPEPAEVIVLAPQFAALRVVAKREEIKAFLPFETAV